jgi:sec-independent protein translocase protein TatA
MSSPSHILALFDVGGGEMLMIFVIALLLFGGQRMPELARGLGKSIREFKKVTSGVEEQIKQAIDEAPESPKPPRPRPLAPPPAAPTNPVPPPAPPPTPPEATP